MTAKILIIEDDSTNRQSLRAILDRDFFIVDEVAATREARARINAEPFDLIIVDAGLPAKDAYEFCRTLKAAPATMRVPIIMTAPADAILLRAESFAAGADDFLPTPVNERVMVARIRNLLRIKQVSDELHLRQQSTLHMGIDPPGIDRTTHAHLLWVGDDDDEKAALKHALEGDVIFHTDHHSDHDTAINSVDNGHYDVIVISHDHDRPDLSLRLIARIRANWRHRDLVIIFLGDRCVEAGLRALDLGANDYMTLPYSTTELITRTKNQLARRRYADGLRDTLNQQLRLAVLDPLTDLHNRRYFEFYFPKIQAQAERSGSPMALMLLDIDRFKNLNDSYGHGFGDFVLVEFGRRLRESMRAADLLTRFGGEEFAIVTPGADHYGARAIAERIRHVVQDKPFIAPDGEAITVTVSIGITMINFGEKDLDGIIRRADDALYHSKKNGRNQINFAAVA